MLPYAPWLCWIAPATGAVLVPLLSLIDKAKKYRSYVATASLGWSVIFSLSMLPEALKGETLDFRLPLPAPVEVGVLVDPLSVLMAIVVSLIGLFVILFSSGYMGEDLGLTRFWFIIQLFNAGYLLIIMADNFLFLFIGWEIVGLCCTLLTSFRYRDKKKAHLGLKVNTVLRVGDIALLIFILTVYAYAGTFNFVELAKDNSWIIQLANSGILLVSSLMFFGGIMSKAAQFPLHEWLPDMLVGTPSSSNALTECLAGPFLMARVLPIFHSAYLSGFSELVYFFLAVAWIGAITGFITALTAIAQRHPQRVMAYSISSIIGYMLTALGLAGLSGNMASGYLAGVTILVIDAFISALLILTTVFVSYAVDSEDLYQMGGFRSKLAHRGMEVAVFAMISIPPFSGFWLCNWVQTLALEVAEGILPNSNLILIYSGYGLFTLLILTGAFTAFYGLRVMGLIFSEGVHRRKTRSVPSSMRASLTIFLGLTIILDLTVPFFIPLLNSFFLPIVQVQVFGNALDVLVYIIPSMSTVFTVIALIIGSLISRQIYIKRKIDPGEVMRKHPFVEKGHKVLFNRFYIDSLYRTIANSVISFSKKLYRSVEMEGIKRPKIKGIGEFFNIVVNWIGSFSRRVYPLMEPGFFEGFNRKLGAGVIKLSQWIYSQVELEGFEKVNQKLSGGTAKAANKLRRIQTGILSYNIFLMLIGVVLLAVMLLKFGGYLGA